MIGIDLTSKRGFVAAYHETGPTILGEGKSLDELVGIARARLGAACVETTAVLAVPAWSNDEQRKAVADQARSAGLKKIRLLNRPTAVALAYFAMRPAERSTLLVIELEEDHFDLTVLSKTHAGFDVLGTDGNAKLTPSITSDPAKLFGEIEASARRVLKLTGVGAEKLDDILCAGTADLLKPIQAQFASAFGREASTQIQPEHAAALGASVHAKLVERGVGQPAAAHQTAPSPRGGGCLVLLAILLAAVLLLL
jgi:molecular chaperone DnaK (HSP70)